MMEMAAMGDDQPQRQPANAPPMPNSPSAAFGGGGSNEKQLEQPKRIRSDFSETWLWQKVKVGKKGEEILTSSLPDTITSWVATGISLNENSGLAVANTTNVSQFK
jgi:hypothetical protein